VLRTTTAADFVRQAAGLQLKNVLAAKDESLKGQYLDRWLQLSVDIRQYVKENVINTLGTENRRPSIAAQCVAAIACAELPVNEWAQVISLLTQNVTHAASNELLKESSLEALGYICQDIVSLFDLIMIEVLFFRMHRCLKCEQTKFSRVSFMA
jgi:importin subunit beta-1